MIYYFWVMNYDSYRWYFIIEPVRRTFANISIGLGLSNHVAINMNNHEYWILHGFVEHGQCLDLIIHVTWNCWILDFQQRTLFFLADGYNRYTMVAQRLFDRK